jgi:peptidoglycan biosynthesis protein MviN/MurJ (putative lipid II flippase)
VLSVSLNLLLIPRFGTTGAALATTLPYLANAGVSLWLFRRRISRDVGMVWRVRWEDLVHLTRSLTGRPLLRSTVLTPGMKMP